MTATDADGDHVTLTASGLPSGATFHDNGNNTGTFGWTPDFSQSGTYTATFTGFALSEAGHVSVRVFDVSGRLVKSLLDADREAGVHEVRWDGTSLNGGKVASGVYYFRIQAPEGVDLLPVTVLK